MRYLKLEPKRSKGIKAWKQFDIGYPLIFTCVIIFIIFQYSFSPFEATLYDLRVKYDFGSARKENVVLITLDEESDEFLGENYPYTYGSHKRILKQLEKDGPSVLGIAIPFNDPEDDAEKLNFKEFSESLEKLKHSGAEIRIGTAIDPVGEELPPQELHHFGYSLAIINVDNSIFSKDDVSRRAVLNISGEDSFSLWLANAFRKKKGEVPLEAQWIKGAYYHKEADATFALFRYPTDPLNRKVKSIPYHKVVVGNYPKGFFENKIVLIGADYISNTSDFVLTPFSKEEYKTSRLRVYAQIIESLIEEKTVLRISPIITNILSLILAFILSMVISKAKPTKGLFVTVMTLIFTITFLYLMFCFFGMWLYATHLILSIFIVYYIWIPFRAIGEYQQRFAIQEETKLLKKVDNLKRNFISLMSHDLKTPVAKIAGLADNILQRKEYNSTSEKNLGLILDATKELNKFITSILDLTKIESQEVVLSMAAKDVNNILEQVITGLRYEANSSNVTLEKDLGPLYPIELDQRLIKRVFSNLIENGIKYCGKGSLITVKSWDDDEWVYVEIKDDGVGMKPEDLENIFEKFYRVKNDASHSIKGSGLGLYLVKYFVELHGGIISVESLHGEGTTFLIRLKNE